MTHFSWRGKPIKDIKEWCRQRGEQMVSYEEWVDWFGEKVFFCHGEMPASFWDNMRFTSDYRNVRRYNP